MSKRKKYPKDFKLDTLSLILELDYSRVEAAKNLNFKANMLGRWIKEVESKDGKLFRGNSKLSLEQQ